MAFSDRVARAQKLAYGFAGVLGALLRPETPPTPPTTKPSAPGPYRANVAPPEVPAPKRGLGRVESRRLKRRGRIHATTRRVRTRWYPGDEETALHLAEQGNLLRACQLIDGMRSDGLIRALTEIRSNGLIKLPIEFSGDPALCKELAGDPDKNDDGLFWQLAPSNEQARIIRWGINLGMGLGYIVADDDDPLSDGKLQCLDPHHVRVVTTGPDQGRMFYQTEDEGEIEIIEGDGQWFVYYPYGKHRFWLEGAWFAAAEVWLNKKDARLQRNAWGRRLAAGIMHWKAPHASSDRQRNQMRDQFASLTDPPIVVTKKDSQDKGWDLDYQESTGRGYDVWKQERSEANEEICIIYTGSPVNVYGTPGFAAGDIQETVSHTFVESNGKTWGESITDNLLAPLAERRGACGIRASWKTTRASDKKTEGEALTTFGAGVDAANKALAEYGKRLDVLSNTANLGITVEDVPENKSADAAQIFGYHIDEGVVTLNDVRENLGLPYLDKFGDMTAPEFKAKLGVEEVSSPDPIVAALPLITASNANADEPDFDHRAILAESMNKYGAEMCVEHSRRNRCQICGVECMREITGKNLDGTFICKKIWRPLTQARSGKRVFVASRGAFEMRTVRFIPQTFCGIPIKIERPIGSLRTGTSPDGSKWSVTMSAHYGEIPGTIGNDGDALDFYLAEKPKGQTVFILEQLTPDKKLDEYKLFFGFPNVDDVIDCYLAHVPCPELIGEVLEMPIDVLTGLCGNEPITRALSAIVWTHQNA